MRAITTIIALIISITAFAQYDVTFTVGSNPVVESITVFNENLPVESFDLSIYNPNSTQTIQIAAYTSNTSILYNTGDGSVDQIVDTITTEEIDFDETDLGYAQVAEIDIAVTTGCMYQGATNYLPEATVDDGTCTFPDNSCPTDLDGDGSTGSGDLLAVLAEFGTSCDGSSVSQTLPDAFIIDMTGNLITKDINKLNELPNGSYIVVQGKSRIIVTK